VDDIAEQREIAANILQRLGYIVSTASSGEEAVELLKKQRVDLVILDMIMDSGMDGLDTFKAIIKIHPNQKTIIASGYAETDRVHKVKALGARQYIKKPYTLEKIGLAVKTEIEG
jgi:DNA-binding NtrC family response regulator